MFLFVTEGGAAGHGPGLMFLEAMDWGPLFFLGRRGITYLITYYNHLSHHLV